MSSVPWWALSPNPISFAIYGAMALYGAYKLKPLNNRDWLGKFLSSFFIVGIVALSYDLLWTVDQALVFGHLYPNDLAELFILVNLKLSYLALCWLESYKLFQVKGPLELRNLFFIFFFIPPLILLFHFAPDPSWTDWTYGLRYGYDNWLLVYVGGMWQKALQVLVFWGLWRKHKR